MIRFPVVIMIILFSVRAAAWEDHALLTRQVLDSWMNQDAAAGSYFNQSVQSESLKSFLLATRTTLPAKMKELESWAEKHEPGYQPLPAHLLYDPERTDCAEALETCFKKALRINLDVPLRPLVYDPAGYYESMPGFRRILDAREVMPVYLADHEWNGHFVNVPDHGLLRLADVITTGSIQPDFGLDVYLYENNPSSFGKLYGFGNQPFGTPGIPYGSQGFFHMSSYQESKLVFLLMPALRHTYPEYRAATYLALSRVAAETSHPYWAATFLGWGLHYIQDMTQPFHSSLTRGLTYSSVLTALVSKLTGNDKAFSDLTAIQANRHILLENMTSHILHSSDKHFDTYRLMLSQSLVDSTRDKDTPACVMQTGYLRNEVVPRIERAVSLSLADFHRLLPDEYASNPSFDAGSFDRYDHLFLRDMQLHQRLQVSRELMSFLAWYGVYTRNCIRQYGMNIISSGWPHSG